MEIVILALELLRRALQKGGPYLMVEVLLPGGTLLALALLLYRNRKSISMPGRSLTHSRRAHAAKRSDVFVYPGEGRRPGAQIL
jgi:hypothetical protein